MPQFRAVPRPIRPRIGSRRRHVVQPLEEPGGPQAFVIRLPPIACHASVCPPAGRSQLIAQASIIGDQRCSKGSPHGADGAAPSRAILSYLYGMGLEGRALARRSALAKAAPPATPTRSGAWSRP